jgi:hypothetical protein
MMKLPSAAPARLGLTAPENAVLLAYAKMSVFDELVASNLPDDPFFSRALKAYFPQVLTEKFATAIAANTRSSARSSPPTSPTPWSTAPAQPSSTSSLPNRVPRRPM